MISRDYEPRITQRYQLAEPSPSELITLKMEPENMTKNDKKKIQN